jgi:IclR family acetate operon transcriptional repressor
VAVLDGGDVLYVASLAGTFRVRVEPAEPGLRVPAHCTAIGKCLLAQLDPEDARRRLGPEPYPERTQATSRTWAELEPRLAAARAGGYALSVDEFERGLVACAVPLPAGDRVVAAINVAAPTTRLSDDELVALVVPKLQAAADAIGGAYAGGARQT